MRISLNTNSEQKLIELAAANGHPNAVHFFNLLLAQLHKEQYNLNAHKEATTNAKNQNLPPLQN